MVMVPSFALKQETIDGVMTAFSTAGRVEHEPLSLTTTQTVLADEGRAMAWLFPAVVECVEEAVLNSMFCAETMVGRDGHTAHGLPIEEVVTLVHRRA